MRSGATDETGREEIGPNSTGPEGFQAAAARCVEQLARSPATRRTALLPARLAAWETELTPPNSEGL